MGEIIRVMQAMKEEFNKGHLLGKASFHVKKRQHRDLGRSKWSMTVSLTTVTMKRDDIRNGSSGPNHS
ncbi:hypothetical protein STEG23_001700, partial [Scotinomys teguina]